MTNQRIRITILIGMILTTIGLSVPVLASEPVPGTEIACQAHAAAMPETAMMRVMGSPGHDTGMHRAHNGAGNMMGAGTP